MTDEQTPRSGSRWEPAAGPEGSTPAAEPVSGTDDTMRQPVQQDADQAPAATESDAGGAAGLPPYAGVTSHPYEPQPPRRRWHNRMGRRGLAVAGGAAALVLVSGLGGFAVGQAVGEHGHFGPGDARFRDVGFHERGPLPPGYGPGQPPQLGGGDQDGDGYGPGVPGQGTLPNQGSSPGANPNQQSGTTT